MTKKRKCKLWYCNRPFYCKDVCMKHYRRTNRHGDPETVSNEDLNTVLAFINDEITPFLWDAITGDNPTSLLLPAKDLYYKINPPNYKDARGAIPWKPGDRPAEEIIRDLRDDDD